MKKNKVSAFVRFIPLIILVIGLALFFQYGLYKYLTFESLKTNRDTLLQYAQEWKILAPVLFAVCYVIMTAFSIPGGLVLTIAGGFLFGSVLGTGATVVGATLGASIVFLAVKLGFGENLKKNAGKFINNMRNGFSENALSYMFVLRVLPIFPFWLVNIVPALLGVKLKTFFIATLFGIIPGTFVYSSIGAGLGVLFESGETPNLTIIFEPKILIPIIGLAVLALLPVFKNSIMKRFVSKKK